MMKSPAVANCTRYQHSIWGLSLPVNVHHLHQETNATSCINIYYQNMQHIAQYIWKWVEKLLGMHARYVDPLPLCHSTKFCTLRCLEIKKAHCVEVARCMVESLELFNRNIDYDTHLDQEIHDNLFLHIGYINRASLNFLMVWFFTRFASWQIPITGTKKSTK